MTMTMTNKKLKELLSQYPDETFIYIYDNNYSNSLKDISSVVIEYIDSDDYQLPQITLK